MTDHDAAEYGSHIAAEYDEIYGDAFDTDGAVNRLVELAAGGPVLELGIGTGRLALPLVSEGLEVCGIDGSEPMLQTLRRKPGGTAIPTTLGNFADVRLESKRFALVVLAVNTIFALEDQHAQVRCFETAAYHLRDGGRFVVEAFVPTQLPAGVSLQPRTLSAGYVGLVIADHDPARQILSTTQVVLGSSKGVRVFPVVHRYAWPSELDLMARLAGMDLEDRWADWHGSAYGAHATNHVSVYRLESSRP
jgi:SAM-dependent methyltransferase